jgi:hypothetical protein
MSLSLGPFRDRTAFTRDTASRNLLGIHRRKFSLRIANVVKIVKARTSTILPSMNFDSIFLETAVKTFQHHGFEQWQFPFQKAPGRDFALVRSH